MGKSWEGVNPHSHDKMPGNKSLAFYICILLTLRFNTGPLFLRRPLRPLALKYSSSLIKVKTLLPVQCTKMYNLPLRPLSPKDHLEEFYTHPRDVASELSHYSQALTGKNIYCNCDDPYISNIFKYLLEHFSAFSLRSLAATCYYRSTKYPARYIRINKSHPHPQLRLP